jgi:hypothetical protein
MLLTITIDLYASLPSLHSSSPPPNTYLNLEMTLSPLPPPLHHTSLITGSLEAKYRLWAAAIFGYVFAAYFMQLLYAEYNNFSVRRLQYLVQVRDTHSIS